ncbi:PTS sugar transporter subunit IIA [Treponema zioleckii]|uniref:PTS sugar transporter subunit IIA n=1 Tax=Treponema zioleckii TaxID=331680 RepID=UPI00168B6632|nr:PTS sugar transporter subunit IIA [Treponema zioleckii]
MVLGDIFPKETIVANLESTEKDELFEELLEVIHSARPNMDRAEALETLIERETKMSTGIMHGVGIPHALIDSMHDTIGAIGISRIGIDYDSLDGSPVNIVFMIIGSSGDTEKHIQILKQLATVLQIDNVVNKIMACNTASEIFKCIADLEAGVLN